MTEKEQPVENQEPVEENLSASTSKSEEIDEQEVVNNANPGKVEENSELPPLNVNYSETARPELVEALRLLLMHRTITEIGRDVENIRSSFYRKLNQESAAKKATFIEEGGNAEEFEPAEDPLEEEFRELYEQYKIRRNEYAKVLEEEKDLNLKKKLDIIEKIKNLVHTQESLNKTFNEFRDLQRDWRETGPVPQGELQSLWENYHHNVEVFYDFIKINKELRDLDLKKNLEAKIQLCEQAEELLLEPNVTKAFGDLQKLHADWREIGPVPREKKDEIWERFREATNQINRKHQDYYLSLTWMRKHTCVRKLRRS